MEPVKFSRGDHVELAAEMLATLCKSRHAKIVGDEGTLWGYRPEVGLWHAIDRAAQSRIVQAFAGAEVLGQKSPLKIGAGDINGASKLAYDQVAKPGFFAGARHGLAFKNGFVEVSPGAVRLLPHAPEHRARLGYEFAYEPGTAPKLWLGFLDSLFRDDVDKQEKILFVQEFFGASLIGIAPTFQQCMIGLGEGENGKSKLGLVVLATMPIGSTCAIPPQAFEQEYRRAQLAGKLLNFVSELPESDIIASESFKAIVDGSLVNGRHIREAPFDFRPVAGHYFAANRLPGSSDQTHAFWRRFVILGFNRSFKGDPSRDPKIDEKIIAAEMPAIVCWQLEGAARVLEQGAYTIPPSHHAALESWRKNADQIALFLEEKAKDAPEGVGTPGAAVYRAYRQWAAVNGHTPVSNTKFGGRMRVLGKPTVRGHNCNFYRLLVEGCGGTAEAVPPQQSEGTSNAYN